MRGATLADYRWLVSEEGRRWLGEIEQCDESLVRLTARLRKTLAPERVHLLLEQRELRRRAQLKFANAERMFFTRRGLEQATDDAIARYKAIRFAHQSSVADLCCGIGGDLLAIGKGRSALGVDRDPITALLADTNAAVLGRTAVSVVTRDASTFPVDDFAAWHIDPDRRVQGRRTTRTEFSCPPWPDVLTQLRSNEHAAIKLAPAASLEHELAARVERQWIGSRRECRQQIAWSGDLARHPGRCTAAVVDRNGAASRLLVEAEPRPRIACSSLQSYVYEAHAAVLAAGLVPELADRFGFQKFEPDVAYLTSDRCVFDPLLATFEIVAALPLDVRRVRAALKQRDLNPVEIKKRGVAIEPTMLRKQLRCCGTQPSTLIVTKYQGQNYAIIAQRHAEEV